MRVVAALAFLVCLPPACVAGEWFTVNQAGFEAFNRKQFTEALAAFETAWPLAKTPIEKAITSNDMGAALNALTRGTEAVPWYEQAFALWKAQPGHTEDLAVTSV